MTICAVNGCSNRSSRRNPTTPSVSFYCLPKVISNQCDRTRQLSEKRRKLWLEKINRRELYFKKDIRICSVHFISGKPAYLMHDSHPDWLPSLKLGREDGLKPSRPRRARKVQSRRQEEAVDEKEVGEATEVAGNNQVASERVSNKNKILSHKKVLSNKRTSSNRQVRSRRNVVGNVKTANTEVALSNRQVRSNKRAANVKKATGNRKVADEKEVAEDKEVAVSKEVAAQGLLELAGMRTREETGLSAVQEWLKLYDGNVDMEQETGLARAVSPAVTQVRFRRIRGRNPREPFFEKKAILEVCKPIFGRDETPSWERCSLTRRTETPEPFVHPYQRILADKLRAELHEAGLICFFHENPILRDDRRDIHNMLYKKGFFLKNYSNRVVQLAIAGTKFETATPFTKSYNALLLSAEPDLKTLFRLTKKMPQFVLLAGIAHDRFLSRDDLQWLSTVPNVEYLLGQTCGILSSTASGLYRLTSHHQNRLSLLLASHAKQETTAGETKTEAPETKTDQP